MRCAALVVLFLVAGCGGGSHTPCAGTGCIDVSGEYSVTASSPPASNTCKTINYGDEDSNGNFDAPFEITQNGSVLTFSFEGAGLAFDATGTLFTDNTASFQQKIPNVTVGDAFDYSDSTSVQLTFTPGANGTLQVSGSMSDLLSANNASDAVPNDSFCDLSASLNGSR